VVVALVVSLAVGCGQKQVEEEGGWWPFSRVKPPAPSALPDSEKASQYTNVKLTIVKPEEGDIIEGEEVAVEFALENFEVGEGQNYIQVILDNEEPVAHHSTSEPCVLSVQPGRHVLRAFPCLPWHESIKCEGAFQMVTFTVVPKTPFTLEADQPLLTYSQPTGVYEGEAAKRILVDFQLQNCTLSKEGYRVRYRYEAVEEEAEAEGAEAEAEGAEAEAGAETEGAEKTEAMKAEKAGTGSEEPATEEAVAEKEEPGAGKAEEAEPEAAKAGAAGIGKAGEAEPGKAKAEAEGEEEEEAVAAEEEAGWIYITEWPPAAGAEFHTIKDLLPGKYKIILELVDEKNELVGPNDWNRTERIIEVK